MNHYEMKIAQRKERLEALAEKFDRESDALCEKSLEMAGTIPPLGQPILIGHHSEKADRCYRNRMNNKMRKSIEMQSKAAYYKEKAAAVGMGGISSDDPEALEKLKQKLTTLEKTS